MIKRWVVISDKFGDLHIADTYGLFSAWQHKLYMRLAWLSSACMHKIPWFHDRQIPPPAAPDVGAPPSAALAHVASACLRGQLKQVEEVAPLPPPPLPLPHYPLLLLPVPPLLQSLHCFSTGRCCGSKRCCSDCVLQTRVPNVSVFHYYFYVLLHLHASP